MTTPRLSTRIMAAAVAMLTLCAALPSMAVEGEDVPRLALRGQVDEADEAALAEQPAESARSRPAPLRRRPLEEDPYAPLGIRIGAFILLPSVELRGGYSDNPAQASDDRRPAGYARILPALEFRSDWSRHELRGRAAGSYRSRTPQEEEAETAFDGELAGRIDILTDVHADLRVSYIREPDSRDDPNVLPGSAERTEVERLRGEAGLTHRVGRAQFTLRGALQNTDYGDTALPCLESCSYRTQELGGRASYELVEGTAVFVDTTVNRRRYHAPPDPATPRRGSRGYEVLAGVEMRLTGSITGEVGVGYQRQVPDHPHFPVVEGPALRAALAWEPSALTTVTLTGSLTAEEASIDPLSAGARVATADLTLAHAFRRNLIASAGVGYSRADHVGSPRRETNYRATLGLEYLVSRELAFVAEAAHMRHVSSLPGGDYDESRVEVGVRLRR